MLKLFARIRSSDSFKSFSMPLSLRYIKELSSAGVDYKGLHIIDVFSLVYSIWCDRARQKLEVDRQQNMSARGIKSITPATAADFDAL